MDIQTAVCCGEQCAPATNAFYALPGYPDFDFLTYSLNDRFGEAHKIAAYLWSQKADKLVVLVHGYLDSAAYLKPLQRWFLESGFDVLCLELPGHGESSGARADVSDMRVYEDVYTAIFPHIFSLNYGTTIFFAHSTGNVGMLEYLLNRKAHKFDQIIMAAPLVRSWQWTLSVLAWKLAGGFIQKLPRRSLHGQDAEFKRLHESDPKPARFAPTHWFASLYKWNQDLLEDTRSSHEVIEVIFAENDTVIDTSYNREFIEKHFVNARITTINNSDHILHYEKPVARATFFNKLHMLLNQQQDELVGLRE